MMSKKPIRVFKETLTSRLCLSHEQIGLTKFNIIKKYINNINQLVSVKKLLILFSKFFPKHLIILVVF